DSLAGRMEILTLWPFSRGEIEGVHESFPDRALEGRLRAPAQPPDRDTLISHVVTGGYPPSLERAGARRRAWFGSYLTAILQRDIRDLANIEGLTELPRLLALLATRTGTLANYAEV